MKYRSAVFLPGISPDLHLFIRTLVFDGQGVRGYLSDGEFEIDLKFMLTLLDELAANQLFANLVCSVLA